MLSGKKTYIIGTMFIIFAVSGFIAGRLDVDQATQAILTGLGFMGLRAGVAKIGGK